jgi:predicted nucleic acid-binding protein
MEADIILCDTDIIIEYFNKNIPLLQFLGNIGIEKLVITSITRAEVQQGAQNKSHLTKINRVINKFPTLDLDDAISRKFGVLFEKYILSHKCSIPDMLNASAALIYDLPFITLNLKDYKYIPGLILLEHNLKPKRGGWTAL